MNEPGPTSRRRFIATLGALAASASGASANAAVGQTIDQALAGIPTVAPRSWVQYIMGAGVMYSKKIGVGRERTQLGELPFIETQIGDAQATCNPNTIKKAYITGNQYGELLAPHDVKLYVVKAGTAFSVLDTDASDKLWLLDEDNLYSRATARVVADRADVVRIRTRRHAARRIELAFASEGRQSLRALTLWLSPHIPFGVVKLRATLTGADPFDLELDAFGDGYFSQVPHSLDELRKTGA